MTFCSVAEVAFIVVAEALVEPFGYASRVEAGYRQFWRDLANGYPKKGTYKRVNRKGEVIDVRSNYAPIKNRTGEVVKIMEITYELRNN